MADDGGRIGVDALLELSGSNREAKAYAFLYAAFRQTEVSQNPVRDAIDCLTPFITPYLSRTAGKQVSVDGIKEFLSTSFGFDIPLYAIEQLMPALQRGGYVDYSKSLKRYIAKSNNSPFNIAKVEIETDLDDVAKGLAEYAKAVGYVLVPVSGSWDEALIAFLRAKPDESSAKIVKVRDALVDAKRIESAIIGAFVRRLSSTNVPLFDGLLRIFMGILVEDFISSVSELGAVDHKSTVTIFYDTAVILRLLGTSGRMYKTATEELNRYLQDVGFNIYYLSGNESEVANIFETIIFVKDSGKELEGETAEAISTGEVSITDIRMLKNSFAERLAGLNVFPADKIEGNIQASAIHQIDEVGFSKYLLDRANASGRAYGVQNREHDAAYLGTIMRLRRGLKTRDLCGCGFLFVTSNRFLAQSSRRYLIEQKVISPQQCPPILSVGQVATIAWLIKDKKLAPEKAGRALLSNCFAAVRPDAEWFKFFREGIEKVTGSVEEYASSPGNTLTLQAARRIAQEESFGSAVLVRELNMAEILSRADKEKDEILARNEAEIEALRVSTRDERDLILRSADERAARERDQAEADKAAAVSLATQEAARAARALIRDSQIALCRQRARACVFALKVCVGIGFLAVSLLAIWLQMSDRWRVVLGIVSIILALVSVASVLDLIGVSIVRPWFNRLEAGIANLLFRWSAAEAMVADAEDLG